MAPRIIFDDQGNALRLGTELGRGGEGAVYQLVERPDSVAKIYHGRLTRDRFLKLEAMTTLGDKKLARIAAWPQCSLKERPSGSVVGFMMPRIGEFSEIHNLYTPRSRKSIFPEAHWKFLIHTSLNLARAFRIVHARGIVIGDVNEKNVRVSNRTLIRLIDCDSYQISCAGRLFRCEVGVDTFTPPELQGTPFRDVDRTPNHDAFGLAVMIFHLLFMGRHPFAGTPIGGGDMQLPQAIREHRFVYGRQAASRRMRPPAGALKLEAVGPQVAGLFERAFAPEGVRAGGRPTASEWATALDGLFQSTKVCARDPAHTYYARMGACPWCEIEAVAKVKLFLKIATPPRTKPAAAAPAAVHADVTVLWARIQAVSAPGPAPSVVGSISNTLPADAEALAAATDVRTLSQVSGVSLIVAACLILAIPIDGAVRALVATAVAVVAVLVFKGKFAYASGRVRRYRNEWVAAAGRWEDAEGQWTLEAGSREFDDIMKRLELARRRIDGLGSKRQNQIHQLQIAQRAKQFDTYLESHRIERANISGIGPSRIATLRSFGIETARDVAERRLLAVPGIGPEYTRRLVTWRRSVAAMFVFDPAKHVPADEIARIDAALNQERTSSLRELGNGVRDLERARQRIESRRQSLRPQVERLRAELLQAEANLAAF